MPSVAWLTDGGLGGSVTPSGGRRGQVPPYVLALCQISQPAESSAGGKQRATLSGLLVFLVGDDTKHGGGRT